MRVSKMVVAVFGVDMQGIVVARHCGEQDNVGFGNRLGESRRHADSQIGEFVAAKLVHRTIISASTFEKDTRSGIRARSVRSVNDPRIVATGRPALSVCRAVARFVCSFIKAFTSLFAACGLWAHISFEPQSA
jgi:hypothetical protein